MDRREQSAPHAPHSPEWRSAEIERIIREAIDVRAHGGSVDAQAIIAEHPHLMPELGERLKMLESIASARQAARTATPMSWLDPNAEILEEDLEFLRNELIGYEVLERIEHAGQGIVYKAIQQSANRMVAIKVLLNGPLATRQQKQRFLREVQLVSRLRHPNIVTLYDSGAVRGRPYFAMEYVEGMPIDDHILLNNVDVRGTVELFATVCQAIHSAHQQGVIHRDIKPSNILVDLDGQPHVLDFGLAKDVAPDDWQSAPSFQSLHGQAVGTLPYASPEQASAIGVVDERSDVYSLGIVLFELLANTMPYPVEGSPEEVRANILQKKPLSLHKALAADGPVDPARAEAIDDDLEAIVEKALRKEKGERYQSAGALAEDLDRFLRGDAVEAKSDRTLYLLRKTVRRYRVAAIVAVSFVALLVASLATITTLWRRAERIAQIYQAGLDVGMYHKLGAVNRDLNRTDQAIGMLEKAIAISEEAPELDSVGLQYLTGARIELAQIGLQINNADMVDEHRDAARRICEKKLSEDPGSAEWRRLLGFVWTIEQRQTSERGDNEQALELANRIVELRRDLLSGDPSNRSLIKELEISLMSRAGALRKLDRFDEAHDTYVEARALCARLIEMEPDVPDHRKSMAYVETGLAAWHIDQRTEEHYEVAARCLANAEQNLDALPPAYQLSPKIAELRAGIEKNKSIVAEGALERQSGDPKAHPSPRRALPARRPPPAPASTPRPTEANN